MFSFCCCYFLKILETSIAILKYTCLVKINVRFRLRFFSKTIIFQLHFSHRLLTVFFSDFQLQFLVLVNDRFLCKLQLLLSVSIYINCKPDSVLIKNCRWTDIQWGIFEQIKILKILFILIYDQKTKFF